jgi:hypothetical protein
MECLPSHLSRALKTQLIAAIDPTFINELKHDTLGFASTSCQALLEHLQNMYACITPTQLNTNEQELAQEWDPSQVPIEHLWICIKECRRLAAAGHDPISKATAMRKTLNNIKQTCQFEDVVLDWRKTPYANQSWTNFKTHFKAPDVKRKRKVTELTWLPPPTWRPVSELPPRPNMPPALRPASEPPYKPNTPPLLP